MPDGDLILPGIDNATPAAPAGEQPGGQPATPPASVDAPSHTAEIPVFTEIAPATPAAGADDGDGGEEPPPAKVPKGVAKRLGELTERARKSEELLERQVAINEQLVRGYRPPPQQPPQPPLQQLPPQTKDFATIEEYDRARIRYEAKQLLTEELGQRDAAMQRRAQEQAAASTTLQAVEALEQVGKTIGAEMHKATDRFPDYKETVQATQILVPPLVQVAIARSGDIGGVSYYLAKHEHLIPRLAQLSQFDLGQAMNKIATAMRNGGGASVVSNAPPPGEPVGGRSTPSTAYPKDATPEEHKAWEKRVGMSK